MKQSVLALVIFASLFSSYSHAADSSTSFSCDPKAFATEMKENQERYFREYASGQISYEELEWLIGGLKDLSELRNITCGI